MFSTYHLLYIQRIIDRSVQYSTSSNNRALLEKLEDLTLEKEGTQARHSQFFIICESDKALQSVFRQYVRDLRYFNPLYPRFPQGLTRLVGIIGNMKSSEHSNKYDEGADHTDNFPKVLRKERHSNDQNDQGFDQYLDNLRRSAEWIGDELVKLWPRRAFSIVTAVLYCLARLSILALTFHHFDEDGGSGI